MATDGSRSNGLRYPPALRTARATAGPPAGPLAPRRREITEGAPRINQQELVMVAVAGQIAHPVGRANPYRIGYDGVPRVLPATGGIVLNHRIGDRCVGLAGDHIEPGVALHNNDREVIGARDGPNLALITYACVGNRARLTTGPCTGRFGMVTGKHGGVNHVLVDFPPDVLGRLRIGDRVQIESCGLGLEFPDLPEITVTNASPALLRRWGLSIHDGVLLAPVTHRIPAQVMGSGIGKSTAWRGDYDIQLADPMVRKRYGLESLRFGDMVAIVASDNRFGPIYSSDRVTMGVVVHGDSTVSGHGPGVTPLVTGPIELLRPIRRADANLAAIFGLRILPPLAPTVRSQLEVDVLFDENSPKVIRVASWRRAISWLKVKGVPHERNGTG